MWGSVGGGERKVSGECERVRGGVREVWRNVSGDCGGEVLGECGEMCRVSVEGVGKV